jgi:hypothetical protein
VATPTAPAPATAAPAPLVAPAVAAAPPAAAPIPPNATAGNATVAAAAMTAATARLKRLGEACAPPAGVLDPSHCRGDLYCSVSKRTCEPRIPKGGDCAAYLPNRSCQRGLYCKPLKPNGSRSRTPGKCVPQIPAVYEGSEAGYFDAGCDQSGPEDQCAPGGKGGAEHFECALPPWCSVSAPWQPFCQRPVPADACANTTSFETMLP